MQDFSRAAQMYLTGAVEYQRGREAATVATASLDDTVRLVQHLEGRLRNEAEAAWQTAEPSPLAEPGEQPLGRPRAGQDVCRIAAGSAVARGAGAI